MAKKYIADTFEGAVTGTASGNVAKTGDTMTGDLSITSSSSGERKIVIGNTDGSQTTNDHSRIYLTGKSSIYSSTTGAEVVLNTGGSGLARVSFNAAYDFNSTNSYRTANIGYNGGSNAQFYIQHGPPTSSRNTITLDQLYTNFNTPLRIGANASANELDDYEEGTFTPAYTGSSGMAVTHDVQVGRYVKIGRLVHFFISLGTDSVAYCSGNLEITGLPFTARDLDGAATVGLNYGFDNSLANYRFVVPQNTSRIRIYNSNTTQQFTTCSTAAGSMSNRLRLVGSYITDT